MTHVSPGTVRAGSAIVLCVAALAVACCGAHTKRIETPWRRIALDIPARADLIAQILFGVVDVVGAGAALWAFLPGTETGFVSFLAVYSASLLLGILGHTPGGVGVFESVMVFALGGDVGRR